MLDVGLDLALPIAPRRQHRGLTHVALQAIHGLLQYTQGRSNSTTIATLKTRVSRTINGLSSVGIIFGRRRHITHVSRTLRRVRRLTSILGVGTNHQLVRGVRHLTHLTSVGLLNRLRALHLTTQRHHDKLTRTRMTRTCVMRHLRLTLGLQCVPGRNRYLNSTRIRRIQSNLAAMNSLGHLTIVTFTTTSLAKSVSVKGRIRLSLGLSITLTYFTTATTRIGKRASQQMTTHLQLQHAHGRHTGVVPRTGMHDEIKAQHTTGQQLISVSGLVSALSTLSFLVQARETHQAIGNVHGNEYSDINGRKTLAQSQRTNGSHGHAGLSLNNGIFRIINTNTHSLGTTTAKLTTLVKGPSRSFTNRVDTHRQLKAHRSVNEHSHHSCISTIRTHTKTRISRVINDAGHVLVVLSSSSNVTSVT